MREREMVMVVVGGRQNGKEWESGRQRKMDTRGRDEGMGEL